MCTDVMTRWPAHERAAATPAPTSPLAAVRATAAGAEVAVDNVSGAIVARLPQSAKARPDALVRTPARQVPGSRTNVFDHAARAAQHVVSAAQHVVGAARRSLSPKRARGSLEHGLLGAHFGDSAAAGKLHPAQAASLSSDSAPATAVFDGDRAVILQVFCCQGCPGTVGCILQRRHGRKLPSAGWRSAFREI